MPLVVDSMQAKHLAPNMLKIISEQNFNDLLVTGKSWFNRQKKTQVTIHSPKKHNDQQCKIWEFMTL